jgi:hypothetical protein
MSTDLKFESIQFHDHEICGIRDARSGEYHIPFRLVCEKMKLAFGSQLNRLKRHRWAVVFVMNTTGADGKTYEMAAISRKTFIMWLATLTASRIKNQSVRAMVELYQAEAVEALDRHFFGNRTAITPARNDKRLASIESVQSIAADQIREILDDLDQMKRRLALVDARTSNAEDVLYGRTDFRTLRVWARERGIKLTPAESRKEGRVCDNLAAIAGIKPAPYRRGDGKFVNMYSTKVLETWFDGYLRRQSERPALFRA